MQIVLISCVTQVGSILSAIISAELYVYGGWPFVALILATFNFLPLILLLPVHQIQRTRQTLNSVEGETVKGSEIQEFHSAESNWRKFAFYMPDVMLFMNNVISNMMAYSLPKRIVMTSDMGLGVAVSLFQVGNGVSLLTGLFYSFLAGKKKSFNVFNAMIVCTALLYIGSLLAFCSIEVELFPFQQIVGLMMMGIGLTAHRNLSIVSKFSLYEKWGLQNDGLGKKSTVINNIARCISNALGTTISGFLLSKETDIPIVTSLTGAGVFLTIGLVVAKHVK